MAKKEPEREFSFCVGRPWPKSKSLCIYMRGSQVHYGTMTDAKRFRDYVNGQTKEENFIYELVKVPE